MLKKQRSREVRVEPFKNQRRTKNLQWRVQDSFKSRSKGIEVRQ